MADFLSIGIPAFNEEESIARMLESVFKSTLWKQAPEGSKEVIVCCNGCTDKTEQIVKEIMHAHPGNEVKLLTTEKGKAIAWNELVKRMDKRAKVLFFADADVIIHRKALEELSKAFSGNNKAVELAGARHVQLSRSSSRLVNSLNASSKRRNSEIKPTVVGGPLYAISRTLAEKIRIPSNIINEDQFITLHARPERIAFVDSAKVYYLLPRTLKDVFLQRRRTLAGSRQLRELGVLKSIGKKRSLRERVSSFLGLPLGLKIGRVASFAVNKSANASAGSYLKNRGVNGWQKIRSAKLSPRKPR